MMNTAVRLPLAEPHTAGRRLPVAVAALLVLVAGCGDTPPAAPGNWRRGRDGTSLPTSSHKWWPSILS